MQRQGAFVVDGAALTDKSKPVDAKEIGRKLGVRYVVEGGVRRVGETVTVSVQLVSAEAGAQVWADRFEGERSQLGELQFEIVDRLANSLGMEPIKGGSPPAIRGRASAPLSDREEPAPRHAAAPQRQGASPPLSEAKASDPQPYCGTPSACRRNGGTYQPLAPK